MKLAVASGKGGTGKTLIATNLAAVVEGAYLVDLDIEEPNDYLFFNGKEIENSRAYRMVPSIDDNLCDRCGECAKVCEFRAIAVLTAKVLVFHELCHDCGACYLFCPKKAITEAEHEIGRIIKMRRGERELLYGRLKVGEGMSPPLIRQVIDNLPSDGGDIIIDCPPGTSCPVVESVRGSDFCLLVTEPTIFGLHDLQLAATMLAKFEIPAGVIINKDGISDADIVSFCEKKSLPILGRVPFSRNIAEKYAEGELLVADDAYRELFKSIWSNVQQEIGSK